MKESHLTNLQFCELLTLKAFTMKVS